jgi:predicted methyltransferase
MRPIRRLSFYGVKSNKEMIDAITGQTDFTRSLLGLVPLIYQVAIMQVGLDIMNKTFRSLK